LPARRGFPARSWPRGRRGQAHSAAASAVCRIVVWRSCALEAAVLDEEMRHQAPDSGIEQARQSRRDALVIHRFRGARPASPGAEGGIGILAILDVAGDDKPRRFAAGPRSGPTSGRSRRDCRRGGGSRRVLAVDLNREVRARSIGDVPPHRFREGTGRRIAAMTAPRRSGGSFRRESRGFSAIAVRSRERFR